MSLKTSDITALNLIPHPLFFVSADLFLIFFTTFALALGAPKS